MDGDERIKIGLVVRQDELQYADLVFDYAPSAEPKVDDSRVGPVLIEHERHEIPVVRDESSTLTVRGSEHIDVRD